MKDPFNTSSYFSLELYWIGWLLRETNHSLLSLISLILEIFLQLIVDPLYTPYVLPFLISIKLTTYK